jgi:hypothetical protein
MHYLIEAEEARVFFGFPDEPAYRDRVGGQ